MSGTGLRLAICRRLAGLFGRQHIFGPQRMGQRERVHPPIFCAKKTRVMKRGNILLIEDNEQNRYLEKFLLEKSGHAVASAADGLTGV